MSEQNPYEKLKVAEDASFEEIQNARDRLIKRCQDEEDSREAIEAAYDAVLMDRLRKRQEGKIKVPEGIRFAERSAEKLPKLALPQMNASPSWLQRSLDTPSFREVTIAGVVYAALAGISVGAQTIDALAFLLALGVGFHLYWINRKEQKLGRAFLLTLLALVVGGLIGAVFVQTTFLSTIKPESMITIVVMVIFWLVSSFLR